MGQWITETTPSGSPPPEVVSGGFSYVSHFVRVGNFKMEKHQLTWANYNISSTRGLSRVSRAIGMSAGTQTMDCAIEETTNGRIFHQPIFPLKLRGPIHFPSKQLPFWGSNRSCEQRPLPYPTSRLVPWQSCKELCQSRPLWTLDSTFGCFQK